MAVRQTMFLFRDQIGEKTHQSDCCAIETSSFKQYPLNIIFKFPHAIIVYKYIAICCFNAHWNTANRNIIKVFRYASPDILGNTFLSKPSKKLPSLKPRNSGRSKFICAFLQFIHVSFLHTFSLSECGSEIANIKKITDIKRIARTKGTAELKSFIADMRRTVLGGLSC